MTKKVIPFKIMLDGKEVEAFIKEDDFEKIVKTVRANEKKTGYERVENHQSYYNVSCDDYADNNIEEHLSIDDDLYNIANYYSDKTIAENNARADKLMRQLRRFAAEHRKNVVYWCREAIEKWSVIYDYANNRLVPDNHWQCREAFAIYFETKEVANLVIKTFHDELIWYFTKYKDSL